jgi:hypothetical protein
MTVIRRPSSSSSQTPTFLGVLALILIIFVLLASIGDDSSDGSALVEDPRQRAGNLGVTRGTSSLRHSVVQKRKQLKNALESLTTNHMPMRLLKLRERNDFVGERLAEIRAGKETVEEVLHGGKPLGMQQQSDGSQKPPMELKEITEYLSNWIHTLHETLVKAKHESYFGIWDAYHDLTVKTLYLWDREYLSRMPQRRDDGSIFLSLATYRDENCLNTVKWAFEKAKNPEKLFVGIVQQNCHSNCKSGILVGGGTEVRHIVNTDKSCTDICLTYSSFFFIAGR